MSVVTDRAPAIRVDTGDQFVTSDPQLGSSSLIPVWKIGVYEARTPVMIKLYREGDGYVAENESLDIIAGGGSREDALLDAVEMLGAEIAHYHSLSAKQVVGRAVKLRETYRINFQVP